MGSWFGFSALFMQYLQAGCGIAYPTAALLLLFVPFISLTVVIMNMFISRYCEYLNSALLANSFNLSLFLWLSAFVTDKGLGFAIYGILVIAISGGYFNV